MSDLVLVAIISGVFSFAGSFFGFKVKLWYIDRDLNRMYTKIDQHETRIRAIEIGD